MQNSLRRRSLLVATLAAALFSGSTAFAQQDNNKNTVKVGISVGSAEQVFDVVKKVAAKDGLNIQLVVFNDYQLPNAALASGDLDANAFQHQPFLDNQNKARGFDIVPVGLTITAPLASTRARSSRSTSCPTAHRSASRTIRRTATAHCCCCKRPASSR